MRVREVEDGVYQISAPAVQVNTCSSYLVVGERSAIVETGPAAMAEHILAALRQIGHDPQSIAYVIPTHIHLDHGGGAGYILQHLPDARLVVHEKGAPHVIDPSRLVASTKTVFGADFEKSYGPILPVPAERAWVVKGGEEVDLGNRVLSVFYTPGHAPHHMSLRDSATGGVFSGEALGAYHGGWENVYPSVAPPSFDREDYLESIRRIVSLAPPVVFFSHDGPGRGVEDLARKLESALQEFGDLVLSAMREGAERNEVERRVKGLYAEYARRSRNSSSERDPASSTTLTDGFMTYFKRKRLV